MNPSTPPVFVSSLRTALRARYVGIPSLATISVVTVTTGDTTSMDEVVLVAGPITTAVEYFAQGVRKEIVSIPGILYAYGTDPDADAAFMIAWNRAGLILDEIEKEVRDNPPQVGNQTLAAIMSGDSYTPEVHDRGGWACKCEFTVEYEALVS